MSYAVTWSQGTKEKLQTAFPDVKPRSRRDWFIQKVTDRITEEIALYPEDAAAQPGQIVAGELHIGTFCVRYEIHLDTRAASITEVNTR